MSRESHRAVKRQLIYEDIRRRIETAELKPGDQLSSEAKLVREFGVSRPTIARALAELVRDGYIIRRRGSGTFVCERRREHLKFGILRPPSASVETLDSICGGLEAAIREAGHEFLRGSENASPPTTTPTTYFARVLDDCTQFTRRNLTGVFMAPLIPSNSSDSEVHCTNRTIIEQLQQADIPIVLIDHDIQQYPMRSAIDLVGNDNRLAAYKATKHVLQSGAENVHFLASPISCPVIDQRIGGFLEAVGPLATPLLPADRVHRIDPMDVASVGKWIDDLRPDGVVCARDVFAGRLMHSLHALGVDVPQDIMIAGIDGLYFSELFRVSLTTVACPYQAIGHAALRTMLERISNPIEPPREVLLSNELIVRDSTHRPLKNCGQKHSLA